MARSILLLLTMAAAASVAAAQSAGWIGVTIDDQADRGVIVRQVAPDSPAGKAGVKAGDVLLEFNKQDITGVLQLTRLVRETPAGRSVELKLRRDNRDQTVSLTAGAEPGGRFFSFNGLPSPGEPLPLNPPNPPNLPNLQIRPNLPKLPNGQTFALPPGIDIEPRLRIAEGTSIDGMRVQDLTDQLREFFGAAGNEGVLVASVETGSKAAAAGIKAGDVVTAVGTRHIRTPMELRREMQSQPQAVLKVIREKRAMDVKFD